MNIQTEIIFDNGTENFTFSLRKQKYIMLDGRKQYVGEPERRAVTPLDMDLLEDFIYDSNTLRSRNNKEHPIISVLSTLWTEEVKKAYKEKMSLMDNVEDNEEIVDTSEGKHKSRI